MNASFSSVVSTADALRTDLQVLRDAAQALALRLVERRELQEHTAAEVGTLAKAAAQLEERAADHVVALGAAAEAASASVPEKAKAKGRKR